MLFNRGSHMFITREGPTQSSIAKHFLECGCCLIRGEYSYNNINSTLYIKYTYYINGDYV